MPDLGTVVEHFHFLRPWWALIVIPWVLIGYARSRQEGQRDLFGGIIAPHLLEHLRLRTERLRWFTPKVFSQVIVVSLLIVLMGPSWRQQPSPLNRDEAALVLLLDVSASMTQRDIQPSRLARARQKVSDLLALRPDKRAALIVYAGSAHTVLNLTADQAVLGQYLAAIDPRVMPRSGKFAEYALPEIDRVLRETQSPATILLITDGTGAATTASFSAYFDQHPHQLLVLGVGSDVVAEGELPLQRDALEELASDSGGHYITLTVDDADVRNISRRVDRHYVVVDDAALPWLDAGYVMVFPALALFLMWFRRGWTLTWAWLALPLVLALPPAPAIAQLVESTASNSEEPNTVPPGRLEEFGSWFADLWLTRDQQGLLLMRRGSYAAAARRFDDLRYKALAYYYDQQFMLAAELYSRIDTDNALFNEANARAQARDYLRAVNRYDRLLARQPDYPGAQHNRDTVQAIIDEINRLSESQQPEPGVSGEDKELSSDDAIPAQGADELSFEQVERVQLSADDILQDPGTRDMWLRGVAQDPSDFLASKFAMQLQRREASIEVTQ